MTSGRQARPAGIRARDAARPGSVPTRPTTSASKERLGRHAAPGPGRSGPAPPRRAAWRSGSGAAPSSRDPTDGVARQTSPAPALRRAAAGEQGRAGVLPGPATTSLPNVPLWAPASRGSSEAPPRRVRLGDGHAGSLPNGRWRRRSPSCARARSRRSRPPGRAPPHGQRRSVSRPAARRPAGRISISRQPTPRTPRPSTLLIALLLGQRSDAVDLAVAVTRLGPSARAHGSGSGTDPAR